MPVAVRRPKSLRRPVRRAVQLALCALPVACAARAPQHAPVAGGAAVAQGWLTTPDRSSLLAPLPATPLTAATTADGGTRIVVDTAQRFQQIEGFGAALTDAAAWLLQHRLSPAQREAVLQQLFSRRDGGAGFSVVRVTIGASDFSRSHYTFDDRADGERDDSLTHFSIAPHRTDMLPVLTRMRGINPALTVMATPWSPPAWMKTSASLHGGTLRPDAFDAYARYLVRFVEAYERAGMPISLLTVQNEPHHEPKDYPGMRFMPEQRSRFIGTHLGPLLARRGMGIRPRILDWDHNWDEPQSPLTVLRDSVARPFVRGVAWHCYAGDVSAQSVVHDAHPDTETWFTECAGGAWAPDFGDNLRWNTRTLIIGATRHWARGVLLWNLALDARGGPQLGGCNNCRGVVTIDSVAGTVTFNEEYYALAHASRFVLRGAHRIASTLAGDLDTVAFRNTDGSIALIVVNSATAGRPFTVQSGGRQFAAVIPAGAVATYRWR
jgi:glucosylceramidase